VQEFLQHNASFSLASMNFHIAGAASDADLADTPTNDSKSFAAPKFFLTAATLSITNYERSLVTLANFLASHLAQETNFLSKKTC
jgi:hypothetical protein